MPNDKQPPKELKVTDKRIFTPEGDIREEFQNEIRPAETAAAPEPPPQPSEPAPSAPPQQERRSPENAAQPPREERRRSMADKAQNPGTPFANFIQSLVAQAYMFLGMLRDPRAPQAIFEPEAAHETIDILSLLKEKTAGNLTPDEEDFLATHLGDLKLAYVQRTKNIG